jgi:hypothetical protein
MAGSAPNFNHRYIYLLRIFYGFFTRGEHNGHGHFIEKKKIDSIGHTLLGIMFFEKNSENVLSVKMVESKN